MHWPDFIHQIENNVHVLILENKLMLHKATLYQLVVNKNIPLAL